MVTNYDKINKILFWKFTSRHRSTLLCAKFVKTVKWCVVYLTKKIFGSLSNCRYCKFCTDIWLRWPENQKDGDWNVKGWLAGGDVGFNGAFNTIQGMQGQVWYRRREIPQMLLLGLPKRSIPKPDRHRQGYCTTRVFKHWWIGTDKQQLHKTSHWTDK